MGRKWIAGVDRAGVAGVGLPALSETIAMLGDQRPLVICGASGHAKVVFDIALLSGFNVVAFEDPYSDSSELFGLPVVKGLEQFPDDHYFFVALGDNAMRRKIATRLLSARPHVRFATLIHPEAVVSRHSTVEPGTVVMGGAVVNPGSHIGSQVILNTGCSVDHDNTLADYVSLAPRSVTGGNVTVGLHSSICIGAVVRHRISIGHDTVVGANSYVNGDLPANVVAYGSPARVIRHRVHGDRYM